MSILTRLRPWNRDGFAGISRAGIASLAAATVLMCVAGGAAVLLAFRTAEADFWVAHTYEVRQVAREFINTALNAETGVRGYLLSNDEGFLDPYEVALTSLNQTLEVLKSLTSDNPTQQANLRQIAPATDRLIEVYRQMLSLAGQGRHDEAVNLVRLKAGKNAMDEIRALVDNFTSVEAALLAERQAAAARLRLWLTVAVIGALLCAIGLVAFFVRSTLQYVDDLNFRTAELENETRRRQESEATLVQVQKTEAVGQLTGGIAHDFNNMLTVIIGNLDSLQRRLDRTAGAAADGDFIDSLRKPVDLAMQGARSAAQLTHRLLAFARRQPLTPVKLDLNKVVAGMSELLARTVGETIVLENVSAVGLWPTFADANQIESVLLNLVVNARDAMPNGGKLTIETANVYLDELYASRFGDVQAGQYALLSVTDNGTGMPKEVLQRIFEPFFTTKQDSKGSGLGLAMVHGFVKQSGGHIRIYSEVNEGTTVKIYLPRLSGVDEVASTPAPLPERGASAQGARPSETILVVEDNEDVRKYARSVLEELKYFILEAADASEAMRLINSNIRIDLLFTDVVLPGGVNGRALADRAAARRPSLPVLFTTGYTRNAIVHNGRLDPKVQLLAKPYTQQDLARKIREMLDGRASYRAPGSTR